MRLGRIYSRIYRTQKCLLLVYILVIFSVILLVTQITKQDCQMDYDDYGLKTMDENKISKKSVKRLSLLTYGLRNKQHNNSSESRMNVVIVTAANNDFFHGLTEFIASVHFWEPETKIAVYDLGLTSSEKQNVTSWCNVDLLDLPKTTPTRIQMGNRKKFAWKPIILEDAVHRYGTILYIDAGSVIRGPLGQIKRLLLKDGYFYVQGQDTDMTKRTHRKMFLYFNVTKEMFINKYSFAGGIQGYVRNSTAVKHILTPLVQCALKYSCLSPIGSHMLNHRYDQSALSIIIYTSNLNIQAHTELLAAQRSQLNKDPLAESEKLIWTARQTSFDYFPKSICVKKQEIIVQ